MSQILLLQSSLNGPASRTNQLMERFLQARREQGHQDQVVVRDLPALTLPPLDSALFHALRGRVSQRGHPPRGGAVGSTDCRAQGRRPAADRRPHVQPQRADPAQELVRSGGASQGHLRYTDSYPMGLVEG